MWNFPAHVMAAVVLKLSCSSDDLAWLTPFLSHSKPLVVFYLLAMEIVVFVAILIAFVGTAILDYFTQEGSYWDTDRVLGLISSIALSCFAVSLLLEYLEEEEENEDEEAGVKVEDVELRRSPAGVDQWSKEKVRQWWLTMSPEVQSWVFLVDELQLDGRDIPALTDATLRDLQMPKRVRDEVLDRAYRLPRTTKHGEECMKPVDDSFGAPLIAPKSTESKYTAFRVMSVSLLGSFDDMAIQASVLKGGLGPVALAVGVGLGAACVASIALFLGSIKPVADLLQRIPVFLVIGLFAIYSFISTFLD